MIEDAEKKLLLYRGYKLGFHEGMEFVMASLFKMGKFDVQLKQRVKRLIDKQREKMLKELKEMSL